MFERYVSDSGKGESIREGPLGGVIESFTEFLGKQGYARGTCRKKIWLVGELSKWLEREGLELGDLDEKRVTDFLEYRRKRGKKPSSEAKTLHTLLEHLRESGVLCHSVSVADKAEKTGIEKEFESYLVLERGLTRATQVNYLPVVRCFLRERFGNGPICLDELISADVVGFVRRQAAVHSPGGAKIIVSGLRSFLSFLLLRGEISIDLSSAVPSVANWRLATLPKTITAEQIELVLKHCDQHSDIGQRDYAILLLLARLGLRGGEVVKMELSDINWESGELLIRASKDTREDRLPLPYYVGEALARYLRHGRPRCSTRRVFIRARAPHRGFASSVAICSIVRRALDRAGLSPPIKGAHLLRHSLATQMLQKGVSLCEIGEVLRHRHPDTTAIYAKVDLSALRSIAPPWPGGVS